MQVLPLSLLMASSLTLLGCGYRPQNAALPGQIKALRVCLPDPAPIDEPILSRLLATEQVRQLRKMGVRASLSKTSQATLETTFLSLTTAETLMTHAAQPLAARVLQLSFTVRLRTADNNTLWRSGLLKVEQVWPLVPRDTLLTEATREKTLEQLAYRAATLTVELLQWRM